MGNKHKSSNFKIKKAKGIPYGGGQETNLKRYFESGAKGHGMNSFLYAFYRVRNYLCFILAYIAPSNKLRIILNRWKGVNVADGAYIGMFVLIDNAYPGYIYIEENAAINAGCMLIAHFNPMVQFRRTVLAKVDPIIIKKGAMLGVRSILNPGVVIGEYAMVSSGSVVYSNVEAKTIVRGNPAIKVGSVRI